MVEWGEMPVKETASGNPIRNNKGGRMKRRRRHYRGRNRHHLVPRSKGGRNHVSNLLLMHIDRHEAWHRLFKLMTVEEVIKLLQRCLSMKKIQREESDESYSVGVPSAIRVSLHQEQNSASA